MPLGDVTAKDDDCICSIEKMAHIAMLKWTQAMRGAHLPEIVLGNKVVIGLAYGRLNWKPRRLLTLHPRLLPWLSPSGTWRKRGWVRFKVPISTSPS